MKLSDFELYSHLLHERAGVSLRPDMSYLLNSRLTPISRKWAFPSISVMTLHLRGFPEDALIKDIVEAMTLGDTSFFNDRKSFQYFETVVMPQLIKIRGKKKMLRIWSSAVSTGQEAYSIAILLKEKFPQLKGWKIQISATDLSNAALATARAGLYTQYEVQRGLPVQYLVKYFHKQNEKWQLNSEIRSMVKFGHFNLLDDAEDEGVFDVIFCCGVLDTLSEDSRKIALSNLSGQMETDGCLILDNAQTIRAR